MPAALIAWALLVLQYALLVRVTWHGIGPAPATLQFFSYFTVLSNLLVALVWTFPARATGSAPTRLLARPTVRAAVALYIGVTALIYFFVLRGLWAPQGWQWLADVGLHYLVPALYWLWWVRRCDHQGLAWSESLRWLVFPLGFLVWVFIRGAWLGVYPYPFLEVDRLGMAAVARNSALVSGLFVLLGLVLVGIDRVLARAKR
jgi:hypothetical protein